jgi:hypothetical protein
VGEVLAKFAFRKAGWKIREQVSPREVHTAGGNIIDYLVCCGLALGLPASGQEPARPAVCPVHPLRSSPFPPNLSLRSTPARPHNDGHVYVRMKDRLYHRIYRITYFSILVPNTTYVHSYKFACLYYNVLHRCW